MRNLKKFLALVLAMMMVFSLMLTVNASSFEDDDDINAKYAEAVDVLTELGVVNGYKQADGTTTFDPKGNITRAEVAAILYRIVTGDTTGDGAKLYEMDSKSGYFTDVAAGKWYNGYVNFCANNGLVKGVGGDRFAPSNPVTGYEALVMILRAMGYNNPAEFSSSDWKLKASGIGSKLEITKNIASGSLGAPATREMVAEIMFQAIQAPMVNYSPLTLYTDDLLVDASEVNEEATRVAGSTKTLYAKDVPNTLLYSTFKIVGKRTILVSDGFGRPYVEWVKDDSSDSVENGGKFIPNVQNPADGTIAVPAGLDATYDKVEEAAVSLAMTPVHVYDNAIDECHMTKDINNDKSIYWGAIAEFVNGEKLDARDNADGFVKLDELHTTTKWIGATGRTTEIYKLDDKIWVTPTTGAAAADQDSPANTDVSVNKWIFVYVDTFLGEVTSTTDAVKDTVGHTIIKATATVSVGNKIADKTGIANSDSTTQDKNPAALTLENPDGKYKVGDLVLIQTSNGGESDFVNTDRSTKDGGKKIPDPVKVPEKAPLNPTDVPNTLAKFLPNADKIHYSILLDKSAQTVKNVTIKATVGQQDAKMGIITTDGTTYYASNTFLAARQKLANGGTSVNNTVLAKWYDVPNGDQTNNNATGKTPNIGIVNGMIGRTYDIVLDHHGYIIGMKEVVNITDGVGVITGIDTVRVGSGKYVSEVEAYMTDGTTKTFQLLGRNTTAERNSTKLDKMADGDYAYFATMSAAEAAWGTGGFYEKPDTDATSTVLSIGSLVQFKSLSYDGQTFYKIVDWDKTADSDQKTTEGTTATGSENLNVTDNIADFKTGQTGTLVATPLDNRILDDKSVIFVAEYEYRYNTSGNNDGSNINKTYNVYEGFKKVPTIKGDEHNILYQQLGGNVTGNEKYVLVYAAKSADAYIIKDAEKITVDDSYLVLSRGATYAEYSEYNVLKNGEKTTLQVSNANKSLNEFIESTMDITVDSGSHMNELLVITGRNAKGYVTSVSTVTDLVTANNSDAKANTGNLDAKEIIASSSDVSYKNGVLKTTSAGQYLTLDDNVKVQLINRDQQTVTEISLDTAMVYATGKNANLGGKPMVFELNELGYVCNLYVIE